MTQPYPKQQIINGIQPGTKKKITPKMLQNNHRGSQHETGLHKMKKETTNGNDLILYTNYVFSLKKE